MIPTPDSDNDHHDLGYTRLTDKEIKCNLQNCIEYSMLTCMPTDFAHLAAAGCAMTFRWFRSKTSQVQGVEIVPINPVCIITRTGDEQVIVFEKRPEPLGGERTVSFFYVGPQMPVQGGVCHYIGMFNVEPGKIPPEVLKMGKELGLGDPFIEPTGDQSHPPLDFTPPNPELFDPPIEWDPEADLEIE